MTEEAICKWLEGDDWQWDPGWSMVKPLIRCKDCVHWEKNNWNPNGMCNAFDDGSVCILTETDADEYCSRAERKEECTSASTADTDQ